MQNQAIYVGMDGVPIDLDFNAVKFVMDLYGIKHQRMCFEKVLKMWRYKTSFNNFKRQAEKKK